MNAFIKLLCFTFLFLISGWSATNSFAECNETELNPSNGTGGDEFGHSVALDGARLAVGAPGRDMEAGSVYLYKNIGGTWVEKTQLVASDREAYDYFGAGIAIHQNRIVVAAPFDDDLGTNSGSVYVYTHGAHGFSEVKLHAADGAAGQWFGWDAVAIFGNRIVVGARGDNAAGYAAGAAYVFRFEDGTWIQEAKLVSDDIHAFDIFGQSVAIGGGRIAVGAVGAQTDDGVRVGAVYVFELDNGNWVQQAKLMASDPQELGFFGNSVAMSRDGSRIIAGVDDEDVSNQPVSVFRRAGNGWVEEGQLLGEGFEGFGLSVAISYPYCAVGAPYHDPAGAAYVFRFDGANWNLTGQFTPSDGTFDDEYGLSVAIGETAIAAGAPLHTFESGPGAVYINDPNCMAGK
jgi:hypothetical protein